MKKWQGEKITLGHMEDWTVIFFGDEQVHWHDTPTCEHMLSLMGIEYDYIDIDNYYFLSDNMPNELSGLKKAIEDYDRQQLLDEKSRLEKQIAELDRRLEEK